MVLCLVEAVLGGELSKRSEAVLQIDRPSVRPASASAPDSAPCLIAGCGLDDNALLELYLSAITLAKSRGCYGLGAWDECDRPGWSRPHATGQMHVQYGSWRVRSSRLTTRDEVPGRHV